MRNLVKAGTLCMVVFFIFSCGRSCQIEHNWQKVANTAMDSVVKIEVYENDILPELVGVGSGFVLTENGHVITNSHVIEGTIFLKNPEIYVVFKDSKEFKVNKVVATVDDDLAILKINAAYLDPLKLEKENSPKIGDPVLALGTPWPYEFSVSQGIVANIDYKLPTASFPWTQHTAAISPGCSGGPLLNAEGNVIGVNQSIGMNNGMRLEGVSLAIPVKSIIKFIEDSIKEDLINLKEVPE